MTLVQANSRSLPFADQTVQCVVTSPPYWGLRDYGTARWSGGRAECQHSVGNQVSDTKWQGAITTGQRPGVDSSTCVKCGAHRIDSQLGLERTPEEYVANMVAVFREVWRVLKKDGTLWLNLGDSYAGSWGAQSRPNGNDIKSTLQGGSMLSARQIQAHPRGQTHMGSLKNTPGLKPKDLVGIPWRVAFALQQPYYTGRIKRVEDRIWLAAMMDAEGCMFIHKRRAGQHNGQGYFRQNDNFGPGLEISNTNQAVVERCLALVGQGSICHQDGFGRKKRLYRWNLRTIESRELAREIYPYLVAKQHEARILYGCPSSGERAEAAHAALIGLHHGLDSDVDFPAPPSCLEPGWYLRSDIIWSKLNPMPESVTDRPTKSHEYLFLLAKGKRYYYDADAVKEPATCDRKRGTHGYSHVPNGGDNSGLSHGVFTSRNRRTVWQVATQPYKGAHFATFPEKLVEPCILAGSRMGDLVLDPFVGSGTVVKVAHKHGRRAVGCDLSMDYLANQARRRIAV